MAAQPTQSVEAEMAEAPVGSPSSERSVQGPLQQRSSREGSRPFDDRWGAHWPRHGTPINDPA